MSSQCYTAIDRIGLDEVVIAREAMRSGLSLAHAARTAGVMARDLDLALWRYIGVTPDEPAPRYEPAF